MRASIREHLSSLFKSAKGHRSQASRQSERPASIDTSPAMKLVIKEYLRSLKERDELDAVLPDLLLELGFDVYSRPAVGTRQYGVDIGAVGVDDDGVRKVFLFTVKRQDLTRTDWDNGTQALRPSLNEIFDVYIENVLPSEYRTLPIVICICFGGDMHQGVAENVESYIRQRQSKRVEFKIWHGDFLASQFIKGFLGAELLTNESRVFFRKSIAMLDEPEASYAYFCQMIRQLISDCGDTEKDRVRVARQINFCLWVLYVWSREAGNLEAPYLCSEFAALQLWKWGDAFTSSAQAKAMSQATSSMMSLHHRVSTTYSLDRLLPATQVQHGISAAVTTSVSLDVNLRLFDVLGRLSLCGIQLQKLSAEIDHDQGEQDANERLAKEFNQSIEQLLDGIANLINNNPALKTPIQDQHAIEINLACCFMYSQGDREFVKSWISELINATIFAFRANQNYPCILTDYRNLLDHPANSSQAYREEMTAGSVLYPTLAFWARILDLTDHLRELRVFANDDLKHCTMQLWFPNEDSEEHLYTNTDIHGVALTNLEISEDGDSLLRTILAECDQNDSYKNLSAVRSGQWQLVLLACRHFRLPIPPNFWLKFIREYQGTDGERNP